MNKINKRYIIVDIVNHSSENDQMDRIDHFTAAALAMAYDKNISIEEAMEILFQQTLDRSK